MVDVSNMSRLEGVIVRFVIPFSTPTEDAISIRYMRFPMLARLLTNGAFRKFNGEESFVSFAEPEPEPLVEDRESPKL